MDEIKELMSASRFAEALEILNSLNFLDDIQLSIIRAECLMGAGSYSEAIYAWREIKARHLNYPREVDIRIAKACICLFDFESAEIILNRYVLNNPHSNAAQAVLFELRDLKSSSYTFLIESFDSTTCFYFDSIPKNFKIGDLDSSPLAGWVASNKKLQTSLVLKYSNGNELFYPFNVDRPDVINFLNSRADGYLNVSGFKVVTSLIGIEKIGVYDGDAVEWICKIKLNKQLKVLQGKKGWLFLGNDSNRSVDQYTGVFQLSDEVKLKWQRYLDGIRSRFGANNVCFLIPPAKESVFDKFYPYKKSKVRPVDFILEQAAAREINVFYPAGVLADSESSYAKTDTHWTHYGAYLVVCAILKKWELNYSPIEILFEAKMADGDLGSKLTPAQFSEFLFIKSARARQVVYENNFNNTGKALICRSAGSVFDKRIIIFGDSFGVYLYEILCFYFREVMFVYSPASPILDLFISFNPDFSIFQINERFLPTPPDFVAEYNEFRRRCVLSTGVVPKSVATEDFKCSKVYKCLEE